MNKKLEVKNKNSEMLLDDCWKDRSFTYATISKKKFKQFIQTKAENMITFKCPECSNLFGLRAKFVEAVSELNYKYSCPYCSNSHMLKND